MRYNESSGMGNLAQGIAPGSCRQCRRTRTRVTRVSDGLALLKEQYPKRLPRQEQDAKLCWKMVQIMVTEANDKWLLTQVLMIITMAYGTVPLCQNKILAVQQACLLKVSFARPGFDIIAFVQNRANFLLFEQTCHFWRSF